MGEHSAVNCALCEMPANAATHTTQHRLLEALAETASTRFKWDVWPDRDARERIGVWGGGLLHDSRIPFRMRYFGALAVLHSLWFASVDATLRRAARSPEAKATLVDHPDFEHYVAMAIRSVGNRWCVSDEVHAAYGGADGLFPNDFRWFPAGPERDRWYDHLTQSGMPTDVGLLDVVAPRTPWAQVEMHLPSELLAMARDCTVSPCIRTRHDWYPLVNGDRLQHLLGTRIHGETVALLIEQVQKNGAKEPVATLRDFGVWVERDKGLILRMAAPEMRGVFGEPDAMADYLKIHCSGKRVQTREFQADTEAGILLPWHLVNQWLARWIPHPHFFGWKETGIPI
jgi:hypothetical protein